MKRNPIQLDASAVGRPRPGLMPQHLSARIVERALAAAREFFPEA